MEVDLHFICKHGENHHHLGRYVYKSGDWTVSDEVANEAIGGRIYLHERQSEKSWHGGTILGWEYHGDSSRKIFTYQAEGEIRIHCTGNWGQEKAIVRRPKPGRQDRFIWDGGDAVSPVAD